jgi:hypothetical protein
MAVITKEKLASADQWWRAGAVIVTGGNMHEHSHRRKHCRGP